MEVDCDDPHTPLNTGGNDVIREKPLPSFSSEYAPSAFVPRAAGDEDAHPSSAAFDADLGTAEPTPVWLHIYDIGPVLRPLNSLLTSVGSPGMFHAGVEILDTEYCFMTMKNPEGKTGVWSHDPKRNPFHLYRESVSLGNVQLTRLELEELLGRLEAEWPAPGYHSVSNNCVDFAEHMVLRLCCPVEFPTWVHGIAKVPLILRLASQIESGYLPRSSMSTDDALITSLRTDDVVASLRADDASSSHADDSADNLSDMEEGDHGMSERARSHAGKLVLAMPHKVLSSATSTRKRTVEL